MMKSAFDESERELSTLGKFDTSNSDLEQLERLLAEFDPFSLLGVSDSEKTHSDVLAWLLNPRGNHLVGDYYLKKFLLETGAATPEEISSYDWSATTVQREWHNIVDEQSGYLDILVVNDKVPFVCAVENKIFSGEHGDQLTRYREALEKSYGGFRRRYLFLSPRGILPNMPDEREFWKPVDYGEVLTLVEATLEEAVETANDGVAAFLRQYSTCLRRTVVPNTELRRLAARIYLKHNEAIDLIIRYKDTYISDLKQICREAVEEQGCWVLDRQEEKLVGFRHTGWKECKGFCTKDGWDGSCAVLLFDLDLRQHGKVNLILTIASGDQDDPFRKRLFEMAQGHPDKFKRRGDPRGGHYTDRTIRLHVSEPILSEEDFTNWDDALVRDRIDRWLADFTQREFPEMNKAIVECLR